MIALWAAFKEAWPKQRLIQRTLWPRTTSTDGFATVANQTVTTNWVVPTGSYWGLHQFLLELGGGLFDAVIDLQDTIDGLSSGGTRGKWRVDVVPAWQTTLSANRVGGETNFTLAAQPRPGSILAIQDGTNEALLVQSTPSVAAPFTVNPATAVVNAHTAGATVKEVVTPDGTHPGDLISQYVADFKIAAEKRAGTFG